MNMGKVTGPDRGRTGGDAKGLERRQMRLCLAVIVLGVLLWGLQWVFSIPLPWRRSLVWEAVVYLFDGVGFLYSEFIAPVVCVVLILLAVWLLVVCVIRFRRSAGVILLTLISLLLPVLFLVQYTFGVVLFSWM